MSGLMSSEFLQHPIDNSLRSSFTAELTSFAVKFLAGNPRKSLVSAT